MAVKFLGFINTVVMARLLMPEDYGLVAMSMLIVALVQTMLEFGAVTALMRKEHLTQDDIDSAWTLRLFQCIGAAVVVALAPLIAGPLFGEPRISAILWAMAGSILLMGLTSLAPELTTKYFDYNLSFKVTVFGKLASVVLTILSGLWLRDYRALVVGISTGYILPILLTYAWHPLRHRLNITKIPEIWALTKWLMAANIGGFILRKGDELAAAKIGSASEYGNYNVGADIGSMPVAEIGPAMLRALLPVLSTIQSDIQRTNLAISKTMAALATLIFPIGLGTYATAPMLTFILLGPKWHAAGVFVGVYALVTVLQTLASPLTTLLTLRSHTRIQNHLVWCEFAAFVVIALILTPSYGLIALAWARLLASSVNFILVLCSVAFYCQLPIGKLSPHLIRPLIGSVLMAWSVMYLPMWTTQIHLQFFTAVTFGATMYGAWALSTWLVLGRPEGLESTIWDKLFGNLENSSGKDFS
jgi:lipopolysaccharide exporter